MDTFTLDRKQSYTQIGESENFLARHSNLTALLEGVLEGFIDGVLLLTEKGELIHANQSAKRILKQLNSGETQTRSIPQEIWHICQSLIESCHLFPGTKTIIESEIFKETSGVFRLRVRWLKLQQIKQHCLLVTLEDRCESLQNTVTTEVDKYSLTAREAEVWLLYRANYSYKAIADELYITLNTVKKHMKNIHAKRKAAFDD